MNKNKDKAYIDRLRHKISKFYSELNFNRVFSQKQRLLDNDDFRESEIKRVREIVSQYEFGTIEHNIAYLPITIMNRNLESLNSQELGWFNVNHDMDFLLSYNNIKEPWRIGLLERESIDKTIRSFIENREFIVSGLKNVLPAHVEDIDFLFYRIDQDFDFLSNTLNTEKIELRLGPIIRDSIILIDRLLTTLIFDIPFIKKLELECTQSVFSRPALIFLAEMQLILYFELSCPDLITFSSNSLFYNSNAVDLHKYKHADFYCRHLIMHGNFPSSNYSIPKNVWKSISFYRGLIMLENMGIFKSSVTKPRNEDIFPLLELYIDTMKPDSK